MYYITAKLLYCEKCCYYSHSPLKCETLNIAKEEWNFTVMYFPITLECRTHRCGDLGCHNFLSVGMSVQVFVGNTMDPSMIPHIQPFQFETLKEKVSHLIYSSIRVQNVKCHKILWFLLSFPFTHKIKRRREL